MNLCAHGHDEVCFEGRDCPCCAEIKQKNDEIASLNGTIDDLRSDIRYYEQRVRILEEEPLIPAIEKANQANE